MLVNTNQCGKINMMTMADKATDKSEVDSVDTLLESIWRRREVGIKLPTDVDYLRAIRHEDIEYLLNQRYPFLQIMNTEAVFDEEIFPTFSTLPNNWVVFDYRDAMCASYTAKYVFQREMRGNTRVNELEFVEDDEELGEVNDVDTTDATNASNVVAAVTTAAAAAATAAVTEGVDNVTGVRTGDGDAKSGEESADIKRRHIAVADVVVAKNENGVVGNTVDGGGTVASEDDRRGDGGGEGESGSGGGGDDEGGGGGTIIQQQLETAFAMIQLAKVKGWAAVEVVAGNALMQFYAWVAAQELEIELYGFAPTAEQQKRYNIMHKGKFVPPRKERYGRTVSTLSPE